MHFRLILLSCACLLAAPALPAQAIAEPDYFPAALMRADGVRGVTVYTSEMDNPTAHAGLGNMIRLAKDIEEELFFDPQGRMARHVFYAGPDNVRDYFLYAYNAEGLLETRTYHLQAGRNDSTAFQSQIFYHYKGGKRIAKASRWHRAHQGQDSVSYHHDLLGRLRREVIYGDLDSVVVLYVYKGDTCIASSYNGGGQVYQTVKTVCDASERMVSREYYGMASGKFSVKETYLYDPRGWLEEVRSDYDWTLHKGGSSVVSRQNRYDDHGKLIEVVLDYRDGKRITQFYDYSYYVEEP